MLWPSGSPKRDVKKKRSKRGTSPGNVVFGIKVELWYKQGHLLVIQLTLKMPTISGNFENLIHSEIPGLVTS